MQVSWYKQAQKFKSPKHVIPAFLLKSRENHKHKNKKLKKEIKIIQSGTERQNKVIQHQKKQLKKMHQQVQQMKTDLQNQPITLPVDPSVGQQGYGAKLISLMVNIAQKIGLRPAQKVTQLFFDFFGIAENIPDWTSIRNWMQRIGIAKTEEPAEEADDWIWMADHSNQIGQEKAFVVLGIRSSDLPEPGHAIQHQHVRPLLVEPGISWKKEDVTKVYQKLEKKYGTPRAILSDGAAELREGALPLKTESENMIVLRDFKHYAANVMKSLIGNSESFKEFSSQVGRTRSAVQQTELAHFAPPASKSKARFMNLASMLKWGEMVSWVIENPTSKSCEGIAQERLEEKFGWLRDYAEDLKIWQECQRIISESITFINEQGLSRGTTKALKKHLGKRPSNKTSRELLKRLLKFVLKSEELLKENERLPLSTEILESCFSLYKQLERQHSKGGFTSLLASFGALLKPITPEEVRRAFASVSMKDVKAWVQENLGKTLNSRRCLSYHEYKKSNNLLTNQTTTT